MTIRKYEPCYYYMTEWDYAYLKWLLRELKKRREFWSLQ